MKFLVLSFLCLCPIAFTQEFTFDNLEFDYVINSNLKKADLIEKVALVHFWGVT